MKVSLVTDEISADPETAVELGVEWGVRHFELRGFGTERVPMLSDFYRARLKEIIEEFDVQIVAISPGLFKCPYPSAARERFPLRSFDKALYQEWRGAHDLVRYHLEELLPASIEYARDLKVETIIIFGFDRRDSPAGRAPDEVLWALQQAAVQAGEAGLTLAVEVEDNFWADTGRRTAEMLAAIDHPALTVNWDPGNAFVAGDDPYPEGYEAIRESIGHVHFKDVVRHQHGAYSYEVEGQIDWAGQIEALVRDGYSGFISVEPHMQPKVSSARAALERLRMLVEQASR